MQLAAILAASKIPAGRMTVQAFKKLHLLAAASKLAAAGLISTNYCFFNIYCLAHINFAAVGIIDMTDC